MIDLKKVLIFFVTLIFLTSCSFNPSKKVEDPFERINTLLIKLESYRADATVNFYQHRFDSKHNVFQFYSKGKFRLEVLDESGEIDKVIVNDGKRTYVFFKKVGQVFVSENQKEIILFSMFSSFVKNYIEAGGEIEKKVLDNAYSVTVPIPERNLFLYKEEVLFSKENLKPLEIRIFDINNTLFSKVVYTDFEYNPSLEENLFQEDTVKESMR
ncbi:LolA family protein [Caldanaerobacter sp.]|uniref:LolA family protein n=1 Tax=Caldanaerobacter sp. TaxID=2930036 RepID=UPI003C748488